jgi:hypothetical protein
MLSFYRHFIAVWLILLCKISAFSWVGQTTKRTTRLFSDVDRNNADATRRESFEENNTAIESLSTTSVLSFSKASSSSRRQVLKDAITTVGGVGVAVAVVTTTAVAPSNANAAAAEIAVEQRCDAVDPRCGADGVLRETRPSGKPIPKVTNRITHVVQLVIDIGERREEVGFLRFGLYGADCPKTVRTMLEFLTPIGITGAVTEQQKEDSFFENSIGIQTSPVTILNGGIVPDICPGTAVEFGVPSQKKAYARSRGLREAGSNFVPQNRPEGVSLESEPSARKHDVAGLVSVPEKGIGYATGGDVDGAYASAFLVTADGNNSDLLDAKLHRRVIGQVIDDESMEFLARLSSLPVQKKGSGGKGNPPLLKVTILDVGVQKVGAAAAASNQQKNGNKKKK